MLLKSIFAGNRLVPVSLTCADLNVSARLELSNETLHTNLVTTFTTSAFMEILTNMSVVPQLTVLRLDPVNHSQYAVERVLTEWESPLTSSSSNTFTSPTSQLWVSSVSGSLLGSSRLTVAMTRSTRFQATAEILVLTAAKLALLESKQEFETTLALPLDLQFSAGSSFTSRVSPLFTSTNTESAFTYALLPAEKVTCAGTEVESSLVSHSKVTVSRSCPTGKMVTLEDTKVVSSYSPLVPISPVCEETVSAIDINKQLAWTSGPQPWPLKPANYFKDLQALVSVSPFTQPILHVYEITCLAVGNTKLTLTEGKKPSSTLASPVKVSSTMTITATIARDGGLLGDGSNSDTVKIEQVEDAAIEPDDMEVFELETDSGVSKLGSGLFTHQEGLEETYTPTTRELSVTPVGTGFTNVLLIDLCVSAKQSATMAVVVSGVTSLVLEVKDKVEVGLNNFSAGKKEQKKQKSSFDRKIACSELSCHRQKVGFPGPLLFYPNVPSPFVPSQRIISNPSQINLSSLISPPTLSQISHPLGSHLKLHEPLRLRGGAGDAKPVNEEKIIISIDDFDKLSYHSYSEESSFDSDMMMNEPNIENLLSDEQASQVACRMVSNKQQFDKLSFHSSSDDEELFSDDEDSGDFFIKDEKAVVETIGESLNKTKCLKDFSVYDFTSSDSEPTSEYTSVSKRFVQATGEKMGKTGYCCSLNCVLSVTDEAREVIKVLLSDKNNVEKKNELLTQLRSQQRSGLPVSGFVLCGLYLCPKSFSTQCELSANIIKSVMDAFSTGLIKFEHGNAGGSRQSALTVNFICWMKHFISLYGQDAPDESVIVLPSFLTIKDLFEIYSSEAEKPLIQQSTFYKQLKNIFGKKRKDKTLPCVRISAYSTHSRCDQCLALLTLQRSSKTEDELAFAKALKFKHRQCYSKSRESIENTRSLALSHPDSHLFCQLDDMDNQKSYIPRILEPGKKTSKIFKLPSKITGTIMYSSYYPLNRKINFFVNHNNFEQSGSKVVSILYLMLKDFVADHHQLPPNLHINLDNCWRENKNKFLFSFLAALVELDIFKEIKVEFLMPGHTGNQCDQLFSILTEEFKCEMKTVEDLISKIEKSPILPKPKVHRLFYIWDWKSFVEPLFSKTMLANHSAYNSFQIKNEQGKVKLRAKKYPQYLEWYPTEGIKLLQDGIEYLPVEAADFREEELNLDKVMNDLRKYFIPLMDPKEQRRVSDSWEKLVNTLTQLPKKKLPVMKILDLPKQKAAVPVTVHQTVAQYDDHAEPPDLKGERHAPTIEESTFSQDVTVGMDVVILTLSKHRRPWVGRVVKILSIENFELQWYQRRSSSRTFFSLKHKDGRPYISTCSVDSVMFWEMSVNKTEESFDLSEFWLKRIDYEYKSHDQCYV